MVLLFQLSLVPTASAFDLGKFLGEMSGALDTVSATIDRTIGGSTPENHEVLEDARARSPQTQQFLGKWEDSWETSAGKKTHESLKKDPGFSRDKKYLNRLGSVARRLIKHVKRKDLTWHFAVLDTDEVNAFAAPGGYVYVTKGLLDMAETEDELAGVIAHEMGHVDCKHSVKQAEKAGLMTALVMGLGIFKKTRDYAPYAAVAAYFANLKFSRVDEYEADECAVKYSHAAGYNPAGILDFFDKINNDNKLSKVTKYFSTHPPTSDRIKRVKKQISKLPKKNNADNTYASASNSSSNSQTNTSNNNNQTNNQTVNNSSSTSKPSNADLRKAYETYLYYKQLYQYKIQQQAPTKEILDTFEKYQAAKKRYMAMRKAAGY